MKILLIEDDKILQKMYLDKFGITGYELIVASDGEEGLKKIEEEKPDFILLDLMMPKLSGIELLKIIKNREETKSIPVAILSVIPEDDSLLEGSSSLLKDVVAYFRKDEVNPSDIVEKVTAYLENK